MKTRKLLALLLMLPLLAYCTKPNPDNGQEQGQEQGQDDCGQFLHVGVPPCIIQGGEFRPGSSLLRQDCLAVIDTHFG